MSTQPVELLAETISPALDALEGAETIDIVPHLPRKWTDRFIHDVLPHDFHPATGKTRKQRLRVRHEVEGLMLVAA